MFKKMSYYQDILEEERSLNNKLYSNSMLSFAEKFWTNSVVHMVLVAVVAIGGYFLTQGGAWESITLGTIVAGILSFVKGKVLLGKIK
jgi:hypothetical protein